MVPALSARLRALPLLIPKWPPAFILATLEHRGLVFRVVHLRRAVHECRQSRDTCEAQASGSHSRPREAACMVCAGGKRVGQRVHATCCLG